MERSILSGYMVLGLWAEETQPNISAVIKMAMVLLRAIVQLQLLEVFFGNAVLITKQASH